MPVSLFAVATVMMHASANKCAMYSGILKWWGSLVIALFKFVGSKHMHSLRFPNLSLPSTKMKLLIQGVALSTGTSTPACSILFNSCWNISFKCIGIGWQGVYLEVHLNQSVYGNLLPGICQFLERHLDILAVSSLCLLSTWGPVW